MTREEVSFKGFDGTTLRGWYYKPDGLPVDAKLPCLILAHGITCLKEMGLPDICNQLVQSLRISCLTYDHRGFGSSDAAPWHPRQEYNFYWQMMDLREAITYAQLRDDVDADKIGLWGYSAAGGQVLTVASTDTRVKAVVALAPVTGGWDCGVKTARGDIFKNTVLPLLAADRVGRAKGEEPIKMAVASNDPAKPGYLPSPEASEFLLAAEKNGYTNEITLRSTESILTQVIDYGLIKRISPRPVLWVLAANDKEVHFDDVMHAYHAAWEPKELLILDGNHFDPFGKCFDVFIQKQTEFLGRTLCAEQ